MSQTLLERVLQKAGHPELLSLFTLHGIGDRHLPQLTGDSGYQILSEIGITPVGVRLDIHYLFEATDALCLAPSGGDNRLPFCFIIRAAEKMGHWASISALRCCCREAAKEVVAAKLGSAVISPGQLAEWVTRRLEQLQHQTKSMQEVGLTGSISRLRVSIKTDEDMHLLGQVIDEMPELKHLKLSLLDVPAVCTLGLNGSIRELDVTFEKPSGDKEIMVDGQHLEQLFERLRHLETLKVKLEYRSLTSLTGLSHLKTLRVLSVNLCTPSQHVDRTFVATLQFFPHLTRLQYHGAASNLIAPIILSLTTGAIEALEELDLVCYDMGEIQRNVSSYTRAGNVLAKMRSLRKFYLKSAICNDSMGLFGQLAMLPSLREFDLEIINDIVKGTLDDVMESISRLNSLSHLVVTLPYLRETQFQQFTPLVEGNSLVSLSLNFPTKLGLNISSRLCGGFAGLRCLALSGNPSGIKSLFEALCVLVQLVDLSLSFLDVDSDNTEVKTLHGIGRVFLATSLRRFSLSCYHLDGLSSLGDLAVGIANTSSLRLLELDLQRCRRLIDVGPLGPAIQSLPQLEMLKLCIRGCRVKGCDIRGRPEEFIEDFSRYAYSSAASDEDEDSDDDDSDEGEYPDNYR